MQGLIEGGGVGDGIVLFRLGDQVHGTAGGIDRWGPGNTNFGDQIATAHVATGDGADHVAKSTGSQEIGAPKLLSTVHVECINLIVLGGHEEHIMGCWIVPGDAGMAAYTVVSALSGIGRWYRPESHDSHSLQDAISHCIEMLMRGVLGEPSP